MGGRGLGGATTTLTLLDSPHSHVKQMSLLKACRVDMPYCTVELEVGTYMCIGGFKLGGMVQHHHACTYMHVVEIVVEFNLAVERHTTKLPNFNSQPNFPAIPVHV